MTHTGSLSLHDIYSAVQLSVSFHNAFVAIPANSAGDVRGVTGLCVNKLASLQQAGAAARK